MPDVAVPDVAVPDAAMSNEMVSHASGSSQGANGDALPSSRAGLTFPTDSSASATDAFNACDAEADRVSALASAGIIEVRSRFDEIVADMRWHHLLTTETPAQLLGRLLAVTPGIELMRELQAINPDDLEPDQRLIHTHLWERCVAWVTDQAAASAGFIDALTDPPENRMFARAGVDICDEISLDEVAITTGLSHTKAAWRILTGRALAPNGPLADT